MKLIKNEEIFLKSSDEYVSYHTWSSSQETGNSLHLIFLHDLCGHKEMWSSLLADKDLAQTLNVNKITTFDFVGNGVSGGERAHCENYEHWFEQVGAVIHEVREEGEKIVLLGLGLGALVALGCKLQDRASLISGIILANPLLHPDFISLVKKIPFTKFLAKAHFPLNFSISDLTTRPEMANQHIVDSFFIKFATLGTLKQLELLSLNLNQKMDQIDFSTLVLFSGEDILNNQPLTEIAFRKSGNHAQIVHYPRARHYLFEELYVSEVVEDILKWLKQYQVNDNI